MAEYPLGRLDRSREATIADVIETIEREHPETKERLAALVGCPRTVSSGFFIKPFLRPPSTMVHDTESSIRDSIDKDAGIRFHTL